MLTFDEPAHQYFWSGKRVPNVTRVLGQFVDWSMIDPAVLENARQEGVAMHSMVEYDAKGDLDVDSLPDWLKPRYAGWRKFVGDTGFRIVESECRVYHPAHGYAGTLDLLGEATHAAQWWLPDLKRSFAAGRVIGLQTAAYLGAYRATHKEFATRKVKRFGLRLLDNDYRLEEFPDPGDWITFLAALTTYRFKEALQ